MTSASLPTLSRDNNGSTAQARAAATASLFRAPDSGCGRVTISDGGMAALLDALADPSGDPGAYMMRETLSNAIDAVGEAGGAGLVRVSVGQDSGCGASGVVGRALALSGEGAGGCAGTVTVADDGAGMDEATLIGSFLSYGGSTRRDERDAIGSKGLGSKAPLAVADCFDVVTRRDGLELRAHVWRDVEGPRWRIDGPAPCDPALHGTTVTVPVRDGRALRSAERAARVIASRSEVPVWVGGRRVTDDPDGALWSDWVELALGCDVRTGEEICGRARVRLSRDAGLRRELPDLSRMYAFRVVAVVGGWPYPLDRRDEWNKTVEVAVPCGLLTFDLARDRVRKDGARAALLDAIWTALTQDGTDARLAAAALAATIRSDGLWGAAELAASRCADPALLRRALPLMGAEAAEVAARAVCDDPAGEPVAARARLGSRARREWCRPSWSRDGGAALDGGVASASCMAALAR